MVKVVGVKFRPGGKTYFFDPAEMDIEQGDDLIVETARGIEFGRAVFGVRLVDNSEVVQPLKPVIRNQITVRDNGVNFDPISRSTHT